MKISANNIWFTSDTHYNHKNICRGVTNWNRDSEEELERTTRDFPDLDVMNEAIVNIIFKIIDRKFVNYLHTYQIMKKWTLNIKVVSVNLFFATILSFHGMICEKGL